MKARLKDVAAVAGVSIRTVSNVVNDFPHVKPEVRRRVQAAIDELGYRPNMAARQLRRGRTGLVALAVPNLAVPYFAELAGHVLRAAEQTGYTLLIEQTNADPDREKDLVRGPRSHVIDGLVLSPLSTLSDKLPTGPSSIPLVLLGEWINDPRFDHVAIDNVAAARAATEHLLTSGHRRVAALGLLAGAGSRMADMRLRGYSAALRAAGIPPEEVLVAETAGFGRHDGYDATRRLLAGGVEVDAIFCFTDLLAFGALRALHELGKRVPEDVAVVGFDDTEGAKYASPSLTSVSPDKPAIAQRAIELLASRITSSQSRAPVDATPSFELAVRESAP